MVGSVIVNPKYTNVTRRHCQNISNNMWMTLIIRWSKTQNSGNIFVVVYAECMFTCVCDLKFEVYKCNKISLSKYTEYLVVGGDGAMCENTKPQAVFLLVCRYGAFVVGVVIPHSNQTNVTRYFCGNIPIRMEFEMMMQ